MYSSFRDFLINELAEIEALGLYKNERLIVSPQQNEIKLASGQTVINFCANNYLGFSDKLELIEAANNALNTHGYGMSSVRFISGTTDLHKKLEKSISKFFGTEDTILYATCFDANGGVFEPLLGKQDAIISDSLNHASIIDGIRLCPAQRYKYVNADMDDLEDKLKLAQAQRFRLIVTDGVFSMDGNVAPVDEIVKLADKYNAMVMIDESHSAGVVGDTGRGVTELYNCRGKIEIITGTLGKAFGGAIGGFTTGKREVVDMLRQHSRPYLFSNSIPPMVAAAGVKAFELLEESNDYIAKLHSNIEYFVTRMEALGFEIKPTQSAICAVMLYDAKLTQRFASRLLKEGIYVTGFNYPVVPKDQSRIRVQLSAAHSRDNLDAALSSFIKVRHDLLR